MERLLLTLTIIFVSLIAGYLFRQWVSLGASAFTESSLKRLRIVIQKTAMFGLIPLSAMLSLWGLPSPDPRLLCLPALGLAAWVAGGALALFFSRRMGLGRAQTGSMYCCGTFTNMTKSGQTFAILGILWKVFLVVILMHLICIFLQFLVAGAVSRKNPFRLIRNQIPGYITALGTQSSAATIPVNLQCAEADGVSAEIRNFVVPLCANIHMAGSMITITACSTAVCLMNQIPISLATVIPFIMTLGIAMVASPGAPGGSIMTALPFLYMVFGAEAGDPSGPICAIMVALYITQDSFGTACNVSGDNAIGVIVETIYQKFINKAPAQAAQAQ